MPEAVIVSAVRTPVGRSGRGSFATTRPDELAAVAVKGALDRGSSAGLRNAGGGTRVEFCPDCRPADGLAC